MLFPYSTFDVVDLSLANDNMNLNAIMASPIIEFSVAHNRTSERESERLSNTRNKNE